MIDPYHNLKFSDLDIRKKEKLKYTNLWVSKDLMPKWHTTYDNGCIIKPYKDLLKIANIKIHEYK